MSDEKQQSQTPMVCPDDSVPKITRSEKTFKPKDPRRVEAGKRLAAISKSAKEKKARDKQDREEHNQTNQPEDREESQNTDLLDWTIPVGSLVVAGLGTLYYAYNKKKQPTDTKVDLPKVEVVKQRRSQLDSFDD